MGRDSYINLYVVIRMRGHTDPTLDTRISSISKGPVSQKLNPKIPFLLAKYKNTTFVYIEMESNTLYKGFYYDGYIFSLVLTSVKWPQRFMSLFERSGWFGQKLDHMGCFALLLLVKYESPSWFYFIKGTSHDSIFQISLFFTLADIFEVETTPRTKLIHQHSHAEMTYLVQESQIFAVWINFLPDIN